MCQRLQNKLCTHEPYSYALHCLIVRIFDEIEFHQCACTAQVRLQVLDRGDCLEWAKLLTVTLNSTESLLSYWADVTDVPDMSTVICLFRFNQAKTIYMNSKIRAAIRNLIHSLPTINNSAAVLIYIVFKQKTTYLLVPGS